MVHRVCLGQFDYIYLDINAVLSLYANILNVLHYIQVREIVSVLDIDVLFYPCPKNGPNFRPKVVEMGGKQQFPYMVSYFSFNSFFLWLVKDTV